MNCLKPNWPVPINIHSAVTLRAGGVSTGVYASLNPAMHVNDKIENVLKNRQLIREYLNLPSEPYWLQQTHGTQVVKVNYSNSLPEADASYTDEFNSVCAILTADCLPVLFCGDDGRVIAAAHAGWRGLLSGILTETIKKMYCKKIIAWLGPAIGPNHFEVGDDVRSAFLLKDPNTKPAFQATTSGKWLANIYQLARINMLDLGVESIYGGEFCTVTEQQQFFSYRRDKGETGRMATLIWKLNT